MAKKKKTNRAYIDDTMAYVHIKRGNRVPVED